MLGSVAASGTMKIGVVADAALSGDATVNVRLNESFGQSSLSVKGYV
jgi:hypothetical protein